MLITTLILIKDSLGKANTTNSHQFDFQQKGRFIMSSEKMKILDMLSENKISVEEATQLLETLTKQESDQTPSKQTYYGDQEPSFISWLKDIFKTDGIKIGTLF